MGNTRGPQLIGQENPWSGYPSAYLRRNRELPGSQALSPVRHGGWFRVNQRRPSGGPMLTYPVDPEGSPKSHGIVSAFRTDARRVPPAGPKLNLLRLLTRNLGGSGNLTGAGPRCPCRCRRTTPRPNFYKSNPGLGLSPRRCFNPRLDFSGRTLVPRGRTG